MLTAILVPFALLDRQIASWSQQWVSTEAGPLSIGLGVVALLVGDLVLPVPSSLVSTAAGASLGLVVGSLASCAGMTLSSQLGYVLGRRLGVPIVSRIVSTDALNIASTRLAHRATVPLVIMRAVPVLAEASVVMAGVLRVHRASFFVSTFLANAGISIAYAAIGAFALEMNSFTAAFAGAIALPVLALGGFRLDAIYRRRSRTQR